MCYTPFNVKDKLNPSETIPCPCGKCPWCLSRRVSGWSFRLLQEDKRSISSNFITFTYDTNSVPLSQNGFMELKKRDLQLFFKRLRKSHESTSRNEGVLSEIQYRQRLWSIDPEEQEPIRYYSVGEYGSRTKRPHYHVLLFNHELELMFSKEDLLALEITEYDGKTLVNCVQWPHGHVTVGKVGGASIGYCLKYMCKPRNFRMHRNDDRSAEFSTMSKGIGENYLTNNMVRWHHADVLNRMYCSLQDGRKIAMPRYYKKKIYTDDELKRIWHVMKLDLIEKDRKLFVGNDPQNGLKDEKYWRNEMEGKKASFDIMYKKAFDNRQTI